MVFDHDPGGAQSLVGETLHPKDPREGMLRGTTLVDFKSHCVRPKDRGDIFCQHPLKVTARFDLVSMVV